MKATLKYLNNVDCHLKQEVEFWFVLIWLMHSISLTVVHKVFCIKYWSILDKMYHFTCPDNLRESGKHPHFCHTFSKWSLVLQSLYVSTFWQFLASLSRLKKESETFISFILWRLYWPSPKSLTGSKRYHVWIEAF